MDRFGDNYQESILEHVKQCLEELEELQAISTSRTWTRLEYRAAERLLHILIEAAIGYAKQRVKKTAVAIPSDAYQAFEKLVDLNILNAQELVTWKKIIGLRNVLVHDYLNLNRELIKSIIDKQDYKVIADFFAKA
ncbi:MAG TPA: DUF86 domain-containing protein [Thioploca sp.]|nr:MAG: DUF86 domain-containing protein [Gammaproteobacteria bacterium]HDN27226.1 DUF86 domain-containing protein [Thioploca sp.]